MLRSVSLAVLACALLLPTLPLVVELLVLALAALLRPRALREAGPAPFHLAVVVPAHNEQELIARCVASLLRSSHKPAAVYVVAHNCTDATADGAQAAGATVLPLNDDGKRGKGAALHFGFTQALAQGADAVLVIDADSNVSPQLTRLVTHAFLAGEQAVQTRYVAEHAADGERTQLLALALYGMNVLRPRGRTRLGLSCGIFGNGFALSRTTLEAIPYSAHSVVEDLEYHLLLVRSGRHVLFLNDAEVCGEIPDNTAAARTQRARWEGGRARMRREFAPRLLQDVLHGRLRMLEPLLDLLALPIGTCAVLLFAGLFVPLMAARAYAATGLFTMVLYVAVSALLAPKPLAMFRALLNAPKYLLFKLLLVPATRRATKSQTAWIRTERNAAVSATNRFPGERTRMREDTVRAEPDNLLRYFDAVFVLNLPERTDRLRDTMAQLAKIDPDTKQYVRVFAGTRSAETHGFPSAGAYGCFQGHLGILRAARDTGLSNVLVLEDDVRFLPAPTRDWPKIAAALDSCDWGIVNLGFDEHAFASAPASSTLVTVTEPLMLAHCYAVNGHALTALIDFLEALQRRPYGDPEGGPMHYDGALFHFCAAHPELPRLRPARSLAGQRSSPSNIAEQRWFDRNPLTRPVASWLRSFRNRT